MNIENRDFIPVRVGARRIQIGDTFLARPTSTLVSASIYTFGYLIPDNIVLSRANRARVPRRRFTVGRFRGVSNLSVFLSAPKFKWYTINKTSTFLNSCTPRDRHAAHLIKYRRARAIIQRAYIQVRIYTNNVRSRVRRPLRLTFPGIAVSRGAVDY